MIIPFSENASVDIRKLTDYCLNPQHVQGKHKAYLFAEILNITEKDAYRLKEILLDIVKIHDAVPGLCDEYGQRYLIDFQLQWENRQAMVRSGWILEPDSNIPKLTTCFIL